MTGHAVPGIPQAARLLSPHFLADAAKQAGRLRSQVLRGHGFEQ